MKFFKIIRKVLFVFLKKIICLMDYINPRLYMKNMNKLLKNMGIDIKGNPLFIHPSVWFDGVAYEKIHLADKIVISKDVKLLVHDYSIARAIYAVNKSRSDGAEELFLKDIKIGENSFIGAGSIILYGTEIGKNVIVGAGSVIKGRIPDNSIVAGNPAQIIGNTLELAERHIDMKDYIYLEQGEINETSKIK